MRDATAPGSGVLFLNAFTATAPVAIQAGGVGGGAYTNGLIFSANVIGTALGATAGVTLGSLVNCANATFSTACIVAQDGGTWGSAGISGTTIKASSVYAPKYTVARLPTCNGSTDGLLAEITDGVASPAYNSAVGEIGSAHDLVFCNGSSWTYH